MFPRCPTCDAPVDPATTPTMPFCSARCREIDLGRWLDERHSLPIERGNEDEAADDGSDR